MSTNSFRRYIVVIGLVLGVVLIFITLLIANRPKISAALSGYGEASLGITHEMCVQKEKKSAERDNVAQRVERIGLCMRDAGYDRVVFSADLIGFSEGGDDWGRPIINSYELHDPVKRDLKRYLNHLGYLLIAIGEPLAVSVSHSSIQ